MNLWIELSFISLSLSDLSYKPISQSPMAIPLSFSSLLPIAIMVVAFLPLSLTQSQALHLSNQNLETLDQNLLRWLYVMELVDCN